MYDMLYRKLSQAHMNQDPNVAQEVLGYLTEMLSTWQLAVPDAWVLWSRRDVGARNQWWPRRRSNDC